MHYNYNRILIYVNTNLFQYCIPHDSKSKIQNNKPVQLDILKTNKTIGKDDKIHLLILYALCVYYVIGQSLFVCRIICDSTTHCLTSINTVH